MSVPSAHADVLPRPLRSLSVVESLSPADTPTVILGQRLADQLAAAWSDGKSLRVEDLMESQPEIGQKPELAMRLIYEEVCLRQEAGEEVSTVEVEQRFPQWKDELKALFDCHRLLTPEIDAPRFPRIGESLGENALLLELDRGVRGRVFLARQRHLADRLVVLKMTPCGGRECESLARLHHTHIVPLYGAETILERNLDVLCMPFLGGTTVARLLKYLQSQPLEHRTGKDVFDALQRIQAAFPIDPHDVTMARQLLTPASYVQFICWMGACLAEALQYAHDRGLLHLDIKPANILIASDGQPLLLDFHLARGPLRPEDAAPEYLGGTPGYMSPEQQAALASVRERRPIPTGVDARSDVYSLGVVLYECLGGCPPETIGLTPVCHANRQVSPTLAALIHKCLEPDPNQRLASAGALAADLRRHLADLPLQSVKNRSWRERWRKWRRRQPQALARWWLIAAALVVISMIGLVTWRHLDQRLASAIEAARLADIQLRNQEFDTALQTLAYARELAEAIPGAGSLRSDLEAQVTRCKQGQRRHELHRLAESIRLWRNAENIAPYRARALEAQCRQVWESRAALGTLREGDIGSDLAELVCFWTDLKVLLAAESEKDSARRQALELIREAEAVLGSRPVLALDRIGLLESLHEPVAALRSEALGMQARTSSDHAARGRYYLRTGDFRKAQTAFEQAVALAPDDFWSNFDRAVCAYRGQQFDEAVNGFRICIALSPRTGACYFNRGRALEAASKLEPAVADYEQAVKLDPDLHEAELAGAAVLTRLHRHAEARQLLERALEAGANPSAVYYQLALVALAQQNRLQAQAHLRRALEFDAYNQEARSLYASLK